VAAVAVQRKRQSALIEQNGSYFVVVVEYGSSMEVFMTASEANRQRVLALLQSLAEPMCTQSTTIYKKSPAEQQGTPWKTIAEASPNENLQLPLGFEQFI
jgi:hypothetical protein